MVLVVVVGYAGWRFYQARRAQKAGLMSEHIVHQGDLWTADFSAIVPAPEKTVFDALTNIDKSHSDFIKSMSVVSQKEGSKTIDMVVAGPAGQTFAMRLAFNYYPDENRITYRTVDNAALDTSAEYKLREDGSNTIMDVHQETKFTQPMPLPDGVVEQVIRGIFLAQLDGLHRELHLENASAAEPDDSGDQQ